MTRFVLDCSVAAAWCFEDEASDETDALLQRVRDDGAIVPGLWLLEISNVLIQAEKRQRITAAAITQRLALLQRLPITLEHPGQTDVFERVIRLAVDEKLTSYDAAYLELAVRYDAPLATLDKALRRAARHCEIELLL